MYDDDPFTVPLVEFLYETVGNRTEEHDAGQQRQHNVEQLHHVRVDFGVPTEFLR